MFTPFRFCGHRKHVQCVLAISNGNHVAPILTEICRHYTDKGNKCCKDTDQTKGKQVQPWPKNESSPQPWRPECPQGAQPPNYDPYRIKVPNVVVSPLPVSNAKELPSEDAPVMFRMPEAELGGALSSARIRDLFHNSPIVHPDYWKDRPKKIAEGWTDDIGKGLPKLGYHGKTKYKFAFHEPWRPLDRMALLDQAEREETGRIGEEEPKEKLLTCNENVK